MNVIRLAAAGLAAATLGACATTPDLSPDERALVASEWALVSVMDVNEESRLRPAFGARHTLNFSADGTVQMQLDCNTGSAEWESEPTTPGSGELTIGPVASTRALCPDPSYGNRLAMALPRAIGYRIAPGAGVLTIMTEDSVFDFQSVN